MVIKVLFSNKMDTSNPDLPLVLTKFFEVDAMPEKPRIIRKLREMGCEFHPAALSVKIHDQDVAIMRNSGILVSRLYKNNCVIIANPSSRQA